MQSEEDVGLENEGLTSKSAYYCHWKMFEELSYLCDVIGLEP